MVNFHISSCIDQSEEGDPQGFAPVGCSRSALSGAERFYSAHENLSSSLVCHNNSRTVPQEAQKFRAARPQRAKTRGGTNRTSCGPFALIIDLGERKIPFSDSDIRAALIGTLRVWTKRERRMGRGASWRDGAGRV